MPTETSIRRLTAIMFSDIVGYTSLMEMDESKGRSAAQRYRKTLYKKVSKYRGEILQHLGDGSLSIFPSTVLAVKCAREVQLELREGEVIPLRIGINVGDIVIEGEDIYGEGVNLASRVESLGAPGTILFTRRVMEDLQSHPELKTHALGNFLFKNVTGPISIYALDDPDLVVPRRKDLHGKLAPIKPLHLSGKSSLLVLVLITIFVAIFYFSPGIDKKNPRSSDTNISLAVLPFRSLSSDPDLEYFSDGMVEVIRNYLSRTKHFTVTSMTSVQQYRNTQKTISDIADELGVEYLIEGSVYRDDLSTRISVQLIDGSSDEHVWARDYERPLNQNLKIHQDLAFDIATALKIEFNPENQVSETMVLTQNEDAFDHYLLGIHLLTNYTRESNEKSIVEFKKAIELDSSFSVAKAGLAQAYFARYRRYGDKIQWLDSAFHLAQEVVRSDPSLPEGHFAMSLAHSAKGNREDALDHLLRTVERDPNYAPAVANIGLEYYHRGSLDEAIRWYKKGLELNPESYGIRSNLGSSYGYLGEFEIAHRWFHEAREINPIAGQALIGLMHLYLAYGKKDQVSTLIPDLVDLAQRNRSYLESLGELHRMIGNWDQAERYFEEALDSVPDLIDRSYAISPMGLGFILLQKGQKERSIDLLERTLAAKLKFLDEGGTDKWIYSDIASINAMMNQKEDCIAWLQKAVDAGWRDVHYAKRDPSFQEVWDDPSFQTVISQVYDLIQDMRLNLQLGVDERFLD